MLRLVWREGWGEGVRACMRACVRVGVGVEGGTEAPLREQTLLHTQRTCSQAVNTHNIHGRKL
jgi:hypothetical protein